MTFNELQLIAPIQQALTEEGYTNPTPIQQQAIPQALKGKDVLGCAQTGTGKTAAFAIPTIQRIYNSPNRKNRSIKALILTPTRELAIQIGESFTAYGRHTRISNLVIFGGVSQHGQVKALRRGTDVLIATPGRLLDLVEQGFIDLRHIELFVLDEADRMLDMGFVHDVKKVLRKLPTKKQTLFFSATMPKSIQELADSILYHPVKVAVNPVSSTVDIISQSVYFVEKTAKNDLLQHILQDDSIESALVFTRTKHGANKVVKKLSSKGISSEAIHGNKSQNARQNALSNFKTGKTRVLVATDIAARGIDVDELSHVINFELPNVPETYVHRIGRTGRAGASGVAISFCDTEEKPYLRDIHKLINKNIPVVDEHPFVLEGSSNEEWGTAKQQEQKSTSSNRNKKRNNNWHKRRRNSNGKNTGNGSGSGNSGQGNQRPRGQRK